MPHTQAPSLVASIPWQAVGATVACMGLVIGALKFAAMWGSAQQHAAEIDRRVLVLEGDSDGVPAEVEGEVSKKTASIESTNSMLRRHLADLITKHRQMAAEFEYFRRRCSDINGPPSQVISFDVIDEPLELLDPAERNVTP
jgi:hypothetical protein